MSGSLPYIIGLAAVAQNRSARKSNLCLLSLAVAGSLGADPCMLKNSCFSNSIRITKPTKSEPSVTEHAQSSIAAGGVSVGARVSQGDSKRGSAGPVLQLLRLLGVTV